MDLSNKEGHDPLKQTNTSNKNILWISVIVCATIVVVFALYLFTKPTSTGNVISEGEKSCPHECCEGDYYAQKLCQNDYECKNNKCVVKDSDNDGLSDIEEKQIGTNPNLYDSDGDTLGDYQEAKVLGTNPLNPNSDGDRYNDNLDLNPIDKDSANIAVNVVDKNFNIQWLGLGVAIVGGGVVSPSMVIAKPVVTVKVNNQGTDYSSYLNYDIVVYVADQELKRVHQNKGKIDKGYINSGVENFEIKAEDVPSMLVSAITNKNTNWDARIENVEYERF